MVLIDGNTLSTVIGEAVKSLEDKIDALEARIKKLEEKSVSAVTSSSAKSSRAF